ncbi:MAG: polyprenol monophosphomannose synthase [Acidobacteria bacterium]|nr:polyprenol monophosphomannose synthase [Acidobacteriota bacterium]
MNVTVVLPTYNERDNLPGLVPDILGRGDYRVLIVDDASPDGTGAVADALAREHPERVDVLHRRGRRGLGRSYVDAFRRVLASGADLVCQMDADLSHDPAYLPALVAAARRFDVVIGSRYLHGVSVVNWPLHRIALSAAANRYVRAITGARVADCTSGFRCWRRDALGRIPLDRLVSNGYAFLIETLHEALRHGARVGEVPIVFVERRHGHSKVSLDVLAESLIMPWRVRLRARGRLRTGRP